MSERPSNSQTDDNSQSASSSGANVRVNLVGFDRPWFTALAVAISIVSAFYSFEMGREAAQNTYWMSRCEVFLEQLSFQGIKVPPELLPQKGK